MKKLSTFIILTGLISMFSCSNKMADIEAFHTALDSSTTETLLSDYFEFPDALTKNSLISTYTRLFDTVKAYKALGPYEVLKYNKARKNWADIPLVTSNVKQSSIYVIKYANDEFLYINFSKNKIQSMLPVKKGNVISGWL